MSALEVFVDALLIDLGERTGEAAKRWEAIGAFRGRLSPSWSGGIGP